MENRQTNRQMEGHTANADTDMEVEFNGAGGKKRGGKNSGELLLARLLLHNNNINQQQQRLESLTHAHSPSSSTTQLHEIFTHTYTVPNDRQRNAHHGSGSTTYFMLFSESGEHQQ